MRGHRTSPTALLALLVLAATACTIDVTMSSERIDGSGTVVSETRSVADFDRLAFGSEGSVTVEIGNPASVVVEADDNLLEYIETDDGGGTLEIRTRRGVDIEPSSTIRYVVTTPSLREIRLSGAGSVTFRGPATDRFQVTLSGAGNVTVDDLSVARLDVEIPGAGNVRITGEASEMDVRVSGVGNFDGGDLRADDAMVELTGVGGATVWVTGTLEADVSGVGRISAYGDPTITGSGEVQRLGAK